MGTKMEMLFDGGKRKVLTLSYDDGTVFDRKLVPLMNQYGIRGTFNLNSDARRVAPISASVWRLLLESTKR